MAKPTPKKKSKVNAFDALEAHNAVKREIAAPFLEQRVARGPRSFGGGVGVKAGAKRDTDPAKQGK